MRKNTLIKLLAVLAMCFLIGAALVACGEAETDADVKGISSVAFDNDGNLVVTYTDNSTQTVELPAAADCEHLNLANYVLEEHTQTANGVTLLVCDDCGWAKLYYNQDHVWADGEYTQEPTCTEGGWTTAQYCTVCGAASEKTDITDPTGHTYGEWVVEVADGENLCEDGAIKTRYCEDCEAYEVETIAPAANEGFDGYHTVTEWVTVVAPTLTTAGKVSGVCDIDNCGKVVEVEVPALNETDYTKEITQKKEHCSDTGIDEYTHNVTGEKYIVTRPGTTHGLLNKDGKFVELHSALPTLAGSEVYSTADYAGIKEFIENPITSCNREEAVLAYYICEGVNDYGEQCCGVVDIYAISGHNYVAVVDSKAATCIADGYVTKKCNSCPETETTPIAAKGHSYTYAYQYGTNNANGELVWDAEANNYYYLGTCANECGIADKKYVKNFSDTTVVKAVDCENDGEFEVSYEIHTGDIIKGVKTVDATGHAIKVGDKMIELVRGSETQTAANRVVYYYDDIVDEEGNHLIFAFTGKEITDEPSLGYFECDHTENHAGGPTLVQIWVSTDEAYKVNTPAELVQDDAQ